MCAHVRVEGKIALNWSERVSTPFRGFFRRFLRLRTFNRAVEHKISTVSSSGRHFLSSTYIEFIDMEVLLWKIAQENVAYDDYICNFSRYKLPQFTTIFYEIVRYRGVANRRTETWRVTAKR